MNTAKLLKKLLLAGIPVVGCTDEGRIDFGEATDAQKQQAYSILAGFASSTFDGVDVWDAEDVDRVTISRIYNLIDPGDPVDLQQTREIRMVKDAISAQLILANPASTNPEKQAAEQTLGTLLEAEAQIDQIRAEGNAFKVAQGWA